MKRVVLWALVASAVVLGGADGRVSRAEHDRVKARLTKAEGDIILLKAEIVRLNRRLDRDDGHGTGRYSWRRALEEKVSLGPPYAHYYSKAKAHAIPLVRAVQAVAKQAGLPCDVRKSLANCGSRAELWISPKMTKVSLKQALSVLVTPYGLTYTISDGAIVLWPAGATPGGTTPGGTTTTTGGTGRPAVVGRFGETACGGGFFHKNVKVRRDATNKTVTVTGTLVNRSGRKRHLVGFTVKMLDGHGREVDSVPLIVFNIADGASVAFRKDLSRDGAVNAPGWKIELRSAR